MARLSCDGTGGVVECTGFEPLDVCDPPLGAGATDERPVDRLMQEGTWNDPGWRPAWSPQTCRSFATGISTTSWNWSFLGK